jgi:plasmid stability protein
MATLVIKNLPEEIHAALRNSAERHHRSLTAEAIALLAEGTGNARIPTEQHLVMASELRKKVPGPAISDRELIDLYKAERR